MVREIVYTVLGLNCFNQKRQNPLIKRVLVKARDED